MEYFQPLPLGGVTALSRKQPNGVHPSLFRRPISLGWYGVPVRCGGVHGPPPQLGGDGRGGVGLAPDLCRTRHPGVRTLGARGRGGPRGRNPEVALTPYR